MAIQVKATARGFYGSLREPGDTFTIRDEKAFSKRWMERLSADPAKSSQEDSTDPDEMDLNQLKAKAKELDMSGVSQLNKEELRAAVKERLSAE